MNKNGADAEARGRGWNENCGKAMELIDPLPLISTPPNPLI